jgi:hypothetical protein
MIQSSPSNKRLLGFGHPSVPSGRRINHTQIATTGCTTQGMPLYVQPPCLVDDNDRAKWVFMVISLPLLWQAVTVVS